MLDFQVFFIYCKRHLQKKFYFIFIIQLSFLKFFLIVFNLKFLILSIFLK
jgi:hypothetical protein